MEADETTTNSKATETGETEVSWIDWNDCGPSQDVQYHCYMCQYIPIIKGIKKAYRRATKAIVVMNAMSKCGPQSKDVDVTKPSPETPPCRRKQVKEEADETTKNSKATETGETSFTSQ